MTTPDSVHSGHILARNSVLSFAAQAAPLLAGLFALPWLIHGLGAQRFGAFQLAWAALTYFAMFDLGLGRAANKFVAEYFARREAESIRQAATAAVAVQLVTAAVGGALFAALVPTLVRDVLRIPPDLVADVTRSFYLLVIALPAVLLGTSYSGMLQAVQRFDLVTRVQVLAGIGTYVLPVVALALGANLSGLVGVVVAVRVAACATYVALAYHALPQLRGPIHVEWQTLRRLAAFGGWVSVSNVVSPIMLYLDRYVIGALLGLSAVAYYTAPYDVIVRLGIVPASILPTLFPAFSALNGVGDQTRLARLFWRGAKYLVLTMLPLSLSLIAIVHPGLDVWLGSGFAQQSAVPAQILCLGMAINAMAQLPFATLQAVGRADLPAKLHLIEVPLYVVLLWFLVSHLGITGAALAWLARMTADAVMLYWVTLRRRTLGTERSSARGAVRVLWPLLAFGIVLMAFAAMWSGLTPRVAGAVIAAVIAGALTWRVALDARERALVTAMVSAFSRLTAR